MSLFSTQFGANPFGSSGGQTHGHQGSWMWWAIETDTSPSGQTHDYTFFPENFEIDWSFLAIFNQPSPIVQVPQTIGISSFGGFLGPGVRFY